MTAIGFALIVIAFVITVLVPVRMPAPRWQIGSVLPSRGVVLRRSRSDCSRHHSLAVEEAP
jgi:hypothetical protein